jgi:hypothetical protein
VTATKKPVDDIISPMTSAGEMVLSRSIDPLGDKGCQWIQVSGFDQGAVLSSHDFPIGGLRTYEQTEYRVYVLTARTGCHEMAKL